MGKATLVLVTLAALGLGSLVGFSLVDGEQDESKTSSADGAAVISTGGAPLYRYLSPESVEALGIEVESGDPFSVGENFVGQDADWKSETLEIDVAADSRVEYKVFLAQGDSFVFSWSVEGEEIYFDFHAHDSAFGDEFFTRYKDGRGTSNAGAIVAAYDGQHGWYWQNLEPDDVTLTLKVAGFYDEVVKIDLE